MPGTLLRARDGREEVHLPGAAQFLQILPAVVMEKHDLQAEHFRYFVEIIDGNPLKLAVVVKKFDRRPLAV